jgi:RNA polymerase sigma-70 factor (ECF subfamily)
MIIRSAQLRNTMKETDDTTGDEVAGMTDESLVRRFRDGEDDAATALYYRYAQRLFKLADRMVYNDVALQSDREGIVQSVFRTFFRRASSGQYNVLSGDDLWRLMLAIALNKIRATGAKLRAAKRDVKRTRRLADLHSGIEPGGEDHEIPLLHLKMTINELLSRLPVEHHQIVLLRIDGYEVAEIAERSGRAKRSIERILQGFRQQLESLLERET